MSDRNCETPTGNEVAEHASPITAPTFPLSQEEVTQQETLRISYMNDSATVLTLDVLRSTVKKLPP